MSAIRTQVYLTEEQRRRLDDLARAEGSTMAAVRRALDSLLAAERPSPSAALAATFGAVPRLSAPDRDEWNRG